MIYIVLTVYIIYLTVGGKWLGRHPEARQVGPNRLRNF